MVCIIQAATSSVIPDAILFTEDRQKLCKSCFYFLILKIQHLVSNSNKSLVPSQAKIFIAIEKFKQKKSGLGFKKKTH